MEVALFETIEHWPSEASTSSDEYPLEPDLIEQVLAEAPRQDRDFTRLLMEAISGSVGQPPQQSAQIQWKGEDTFTWGDQRIWAHAAWMRCISARDTVSDCLYEYPDLKAILLQPILYRLTRNYRVENRSRVSDFIYQNPMLLDVLDVGHAKVFEIFGEDARISLEVTHDREGKENPRLFAYIHTQFPIEIALERLSQLDDEWLIHQPDEILEVFNIDFVSE